MADSPGTEAGRRLLDGLGLGRPDAVARVYAECLADVEREARAAALAAVRERVEALMDEWRDDSLRHGYTVLYAGNRFLAILDDLSGDRT